MSVRPEIDNGRESPETAAERLTPLHAGHRLSDEIYNIIFAEAGDGIFLADAEGNYIDVNERGCRLLRYSRGELLGKNLAELVDPEDVAKQPIRLDKMRAGKTLIRERRMIRGDGSRIDTEITGCQLSNGCLLGIVRDISRRKAAEAALQQAHDELEERVGQRTAELAASEERYRALFDHALDPIFLTSPDGRFIDLNPACVKMYGASREEVMATPVRDTYADPGERERMVADLRERGVIHDREIKLRLADGSTRDVLLSAWTRRSDDGEEVWFEGTVHDITERKQAEEKLRRSEERFRSLVETTADWVWQTDRRGAFTYANPRVAELLGYQPDELLGITWTRLLADEDQAGDIITAMAGRRPYARLERTLRHRRGQAVILESSAAPYFDGDGRWLGYRGIDRDVTEARRMAAALEAAHALEDQAREVRFGAVVRSMSEGLLVIDEHGLIRFANEAAARMLGVPLGNLFSRPAETVTPAVGWRSFIRDWVEGRPAGAPLELSLPDGEDTRYLMARAEALEMPAKRRSGVVCVLTDVTSFRRMDMMKSYLMAFASHELQNPIAVMRSATKDCLQSTQDPWATATLRLVEQQAALLSNLVQQFLEVARVESGGLVAVNRTRFEVAPVLSEAAALSAAAAPGRTVDITCDPPTFLLNADRDKIVHILLNLLSNAFKHSPRQAPVSMRAESIDGGVRFAVSDQGDGVPPAVRARVFQPFFHGDDTPDGAGIGLFLCKQLVVAHSGEIAIDDNPQGGTIVSFTIPQRQPRRSPGP